MVIALAMAITGAQATSPSVGVAVVHGTAWSLESTREGAAELAVAIRVAQLRRMHSAVALICVGDRHGTLGHGGERALRRAVLMGVLVVRVASSGDVASTSEDLFLGSGTRDPAAVERMLTPLLQRHGPPPAVAEPERPTPRELVAIRTHLKPFRRALQSIAGGTGAAFGDTPEKALAEVGIAMDGWPKTVRTRGSQFPSPPIDPPFAIWPPANVPGSLHPHPTSAASSAGVWR